MIRQTIFYCVIAFVGSFIAFFLVPHVMSIGSVAQYGFGLASGGAVAEDSAVDQVYRSSRITCDMPHLNASDAVQAISVERGEKLSPIPKLLTPPTQIDVFLTDTQHPIALLLSAKDAVVWYLHAVQGAKLSAIVTVGLDQQIVLGAPSTISATSLVVADNCENNISRFGLNVSSSLTREALEGFTQLAFEHSLAGYQHDSTGSEYWIGPQIDKAVFGPLPAFAIPEDLVDQQRPVLFGRTALKRLEAAGAIRPATAADLDAWQGIAKSRSITLPDHLMAPDLQHAYVTLQSFRLPLGLVGDASTLFIVPPGKAIPTGFLQDSVMLVSDPFACRTRDTNSAKCQAIPSFQH